MPSAFKSKYSGQRFYEIGRNLKNYNFYGWGVSSSGNMRFVARILEDLGYEKIVMILDGDDHALKIRDSLVAEFPNYQTYNLPVADIRDKKNLRR